MTGSPALRRPWTPADANRTLVCERCGAAFGCTANGEAGSCWCSEAEFRLPVPLPEGVGPYGDCLCPACMAKVADELRALGHGPR
jgi:hypothetical protein